MLKPMEWSRAIREEGFPLELDTDFDPVEHTGFLPCKYEGAAAGFEYFFGEVAEMELEPEIVEELEGRDVAVTFTTHSDLRELVSASIAAAVLCARADGLFFDESSGDVVYAGEVLDLAREEAASIR
jgi:hypothetical protein